MNKKISLLPILSLLLLGSITNKVNNSNNNKVMQMMISNYNDYSLKLENEPNYNEQSNYHLSALDLTAISDTYRGDNVTIAVIDTGCNYNHEDFTYLNSSGTSISNKSACFTYSYTTNKVTKETVLEDGYDVIKDTNGHGTNVVSTIASRINNVGGAGVASNVEIMVLKASGLINLEVSEAIKYAVSNGADIISISIELYGTTFTSPATNKEVTGYSGASSFFSSAINTAYKNNVAVVAAAGNQNTYYSSYPAANAHVIGVGALEKASRTTKASYSNYNSSGSTINTNNNVDVTVTGSVYVSSNASDNKSYKATQGTSFSCPIVASLLALYKQKNPSATVDEMYDALYNSCDDLGSSGWDTTYGYGVVNTTKLLNYSTSVTGIEVDKNDFEIFKGDSSTITAKVVPNYAINKNINWVVEDESIISLNKYNSISGEKITVTANKIGTTNIIVTSEEGNYTTTIKVTVTDYISSLISLDSDNYIMYPEETRKINYSFIYDNPSITDISFSSSDDTIASVDTNGIITAKKVGEVDIKIGTYDDSKVLHVSVKNIYVTNIEVIDYIDTISFKGEYDYSKIKVKATYNNNSTSIITNFNHTNIDTSILGKQTINVSFDNEIEILKVELDIYVTNENATREVISSEAKTINFDLSSKVFSKSGDSITSGEVTLTLTTDGGYFGYDGTKGQQIGSKKAPAKNITLIGTTTDLVKEIVIETSTASGTVKLEASINNTKLLCNNSESVSISSSSTKYSFISNTPLSGEINLSWTQTTSKAIYIKNIQIITSGETSYSWTGDEQAKATIDLLNRYSSCPIWEDRNEIVKLVNEYNNQIADAKNSSLWNISFIDNGNYNVTPLEKITSLVSRYNETLQNNEIELILKDADDNVITTRKLSNNNFDNEYVLLPVMVLVISFAIYGLLIIKRRKQ